MGVGFSFNLISSEFSIITAILNLNIGGFWGFDYAHRGSDNKQQ